ncbi:MAG: ABC transporter ATP-binding protein [bacterium]
MNVLAVDDAKKAYGATLALDGVAFELREGELLGLLGPNGAGKTTLVKAVSGRVRLDAGEIFLFGKAVAPLEPRSGLGIVPQEIAIYPLLTARENLEVFGSLNGVNRARLKEKVEWALEWTALADRQKEPVKRFSGGMKRRLNIACGILHDPKVVLLDEPTAGVDPQSRERIYEMLLQLRASGAALLLTTHQLDEAETLCDRIVIIDDGKVIASGALADLVERTIGGRRIVTFTFDHAPAMAIDGFEPVNNGLAWRASVADVAAELPALLARVQGAGLHIEDVQVRGPTLHSVFIHLTGRELRE